MRPAHRGEVSEGVATQSNRLEHALEVARKKTASLFALAAKSAAHICEAGQSSIQEAALFGEKLGISFQVMDDILDVVGSIDVIGKEPGTDIREQKPSLINALWLESNSPLAKELLTAEDSPDPDQIRAGLAEVRQRGIVDQASQIAADFLSQAQVHLDSAVSQAPNTNQQAIADLKAFLDYLSSRSA